MDNITTQPRQTYNRRKKIKKPMDMNIGITLEPSEEMFVMMIMAYQYGIIPRVTDDGVQIYQVR
jgi:hypothetical protein